MSDIPSDFFERQDRARRATNRLVLWFAFGVAGTALAIYAVVRFALTQSGVPGLTETYFPAWSAAGTAAEPWWDPLLLAVVAAGTLIVVGGASLMKSLELGDSTGADVAKQLGGREVSPASGAPDERRLVNVVQEMSLASGVPVPRIFILENENCINAFAAGTRPNRAAIAVSRGALDKLSRDELQAVVGHEYSHILNGDMRLNIRLVGWIFGLVVISIFGEILLRSAAWESRGRRSEKGNPAAILIGIGLALLVIGFVSRIFAQLIQAAISRSRERLADASATQFTRNPSALANALARIGGDALGGRMASPRAGEFAHLFFANGVNALFATHPPLEERIRALNPRWDGKFLPPYAHARGDAETVRPERATPRKPAALPAVFRELAGNASDAKALIYLLTMTESPEHNVEQAKLLLSRERAALFGKMEALWPEIGKIPREKRISGALIAAPALRELSARERRDFLETLALLARADGKITLCEFCILSAVEGVLSDDSGKNDLSAAAVAPEAELLLSLFLRESGVPAERRRETLEAALAAAGKNALPLGLRPRADSELTVPALEAAFGKMRRADLRVREALLLAASAIAQADGKITPTESDLLGTLAVALGCPRP
ncbi:MAG: M48 family metallopeptidase [Candidatus Spyradosoma sp.]